MSASQRLKSTCASAKSDQNLSCSAWRNFASLAIQITLSEDSDQTARMSEGTFNDVAVHLIKLSLNCLTITVDYGSWFDYTLSWERVIQDNPNLPVHVMSYEDMKKV